MSAFKRVLMHFQRAVRPPSYLTRQTHVMRYQVTVKNTGAKVNELTIVVPIPGKMEGQAIVSSARFTPAVAKTEVDARFGNQFAVWTAKLAPGESRLFTEHVTVAVSPIKKKLTAANLSDYEQKEEVYLTATAHLGAGDEQIAILAKQTANGTTDVGELINRFNELVISRLEYGNPINGLYSASQALKEVKVDCGGYDSLFVALCVALGIPARIVSGFWAGYPKNEMHAWAQVQLPDGGWVSVDPSIESLGRQARTKKLGKLGETGSDRIAFSVGCDIPLNVFSKPRQIDILQHPVVEASLGEGSFSVITTVNTTKA